MNVTQSTLTLQVPPELLPDTPPEAKVTVTLTAEQLVYLIKAFNHYKYQPDSTRTRVLRHPVGLLLMSARERLLHPWYWRRHQRLHM